MAAKKAGLIEKLSPATLSFMKNTQKEQSKGRLQAPGAEMEGFARLYHIVQQLRSPQGCPWDQKQTPQSLRSALIEEAYEAVEAINEEDTQHTGEELGDVLLIVTLIAAIFEERKTLSMEGILHDVCEKLIRRHPHVFAAADADNPEAVARQWEEIKQTVEGRRKKDSVLDSVSKGMPPLERAYKLQKKAAKCGFDWKNAEDVWAKIYEELEETHQAWRESSSDQQEQRAHLEEELGDMLFSVVNVARFLDIDPAIAMQRSNEKFERRFRFVEKKMGTDAMGPDQFDRMNELWDQAKQQKLY